MLDDRPWRDDEEDWSETDDEDDDLDEEEAARCPECGGPVHIVTDKCPACGYWLSDADRRAMWSGMSQPRGVKTIAAVILVVFIALLLLAGLAMF
jgi:hypothetical protein